MSATEELANQLVLRNFTQLGGSLAPLTQDLSRGLIPVALLGGLSFSLASALFLWLSYRMLRSNFRSRHVNQFVVLIWNLLLADIQQSMAFLLNAKWLMENRIQIGTTACWAQGWFISTGDLASGVWSFAIGVHTFAVVIFDYRLSNAKFMVTVFLLWAFVYAMALVGVAMHPQDIYVRAAAWCWVNVKYGGLRLWLHYFWIFLFEFGTIAIYTVLIFALRWRIQSNFYQGYRRTRHAQDAAKLMVAYPLIYVVCTLPLATLRMYQQANDMRVSEKWFCFAGAMITSNGWLDVILYCCTRRIVLFSDTPGDMDNGIETFQTPWMRGDVFGTQTTCEHMPTPFPSGRVSLEEPMVVLPDKPYKRQDSSEAMEIFGGKAGIAAQQTVTISSTPMTAEQRRIAESGYQGNKRRSQLWPCESVDDGSQSRDETTRPGTPSSSVAEYEIESLQFDTKPAGF